LGPEGAGSAEVFGLHGAVHDVHRLYEGVGALAADKIIAFQAVFVFHIPITSYEDIK
jgi:hypothetical protein